VDVMIVNRKMPKNKTNRALKLLTKCLKNKTQPNISKLLRIIKNNFNLSFLQKQTCSNTMLKINNRSIKKIKNDKNNNLQRPFHPTLGSHRCYYKLAIHLQALVISCIEGEHPIQMLPTLKIHVKTHAQDHHFMEMSPSFTQNESLNTLKYFTLNLTKDI
jgi:hypothetical protein